METTVVYYRQDGQVLAARPDPSRPEFYRDNILVRRFTDVFGHVPAEEDALLWTEGQVFFSTTGVHEPEWARDFYMGDADGKNGCWAPSPRNAVPQYVGVRFGVPVRVTGFQFASGVGGTVNCPFASSPCGHPTAFVLEASNDETNWVPLLTVAAVGMRVAVKSLFAYEDDSYWDGGVGLSDRMDVPNDAHFLAYRMVVTAFKPDIRGNYNVSELVFYGTL